MIRQVHPKKIKYISDDSETEGLKKEKTKQLRQKLKECQNQKEEYLLQAQRAVADLINYRKRQEQVLEEFRKYGQRGLLNDLLPVIDALSAGARPNDHSVGQAKKDSGLAKVKKQLEEILTKNGLTEIAALGEKFNPEIHEAVDVAEAKETSGTIIGEIQKGYLLRDKVLRPSKVRIAK